MAAIRPTIPPSVRAEAKSHRAAKVAEAEAQAQAKAEAAALAESARLEKEATADAESGGAGAAETAAAAISASAALAAVNDAAGTQSRFHRRLEDFAPWEELHLVDLSPALSDEANLLRLIGALPKRALHSTTTKSAALALSASSSFSSVPSSVSAAISLAYNLRAVSLEVGAPGGVAGVDFVTDRLLKALHAGAWGGGSELQGQNHTTADAWQNMVIACHSFNFHRKQKFESSVRQ